METISQAEELSDLRLRAGEKTVSPIINRFPASLMSIQMYEKLRKHADIRFEIKKVVKTSDKVFLLMQVAVMLDLRIITLSDGYY